MHFHIYNILSKILPGRMVKLRRIFAKSAGFDIHENVKLSNSVQLYGRCIAIHRNTWLSPGVCIFANERGYVRIGENCDIGHLTNIVTGSHELGDCLRRAGTNKSLPVIIGNGCWIGAGCLILGGAEIGSGTIVAAGSVVIKGTYPDNHLLAGCPAKIKRELPDI